MQPAAELADGTEAIVVTGSRIARDGYDAPTPVSVIGAKELKAESPANIADFVNTLPSVRGSSTAANSSGSLSNGIAGIASINLRALGAARTLVLFDGQRSVASSTGGIVDVNQWNRLNAKWPLSLLQPPTVFRDYLFVGWAGKDWAEAEAPPGTVFALDARTGKQVWQVNRGGNLYATNTTGPVPQRASAGASKRHSLCTPGACSSSVSAPTGQPPPGKWLGDRFRVEARIITWKADPVLQVPSGALFRRGDDWMAFLLEDGKASAVQVSAGHNNGLQAEVKSGLALGQTVLLHPPDKVTDGRAVVPRK